jgi:hypothetical protein
MSAPLQAQQDGQQPAGSHAGRSADIRCQADAGSIGRMHTRHRRRWLSAVGVAVAALPAHAQPASKAQPMLDDSMIDAEVPRFDPVPSAPTTPSPGRPGDFAFLDGRWRIRHLKRRASGRDRFESAKPAASASSAASAASKSC